MPPGAAEEIVSNFDHPGEEQSSKFIVKRGSISPSDRIPMQLSHTVVIKTGWATIASAKEPNGRVAEACAEVIAKAAT